MTDDSDDSWKGMARYARREAAALKHDDRTLGQSLADLIDNSIDAGANNVLVNFGHQVVNGITSYYVVIVDDGKGIDPPNGETDPLHNALEFGAEREYNEWELGFFGVGMKNSTIPHADEISLISKVEGGGLHNRRLSIPLVEEKNSWGTVSLTPEQEGTKALKIAKLLLDQCSSGTAIVLENMRKIRQAEFIAQTSIIKSYLAMVFHRYLEGVEIGPFENRKIKIFLNGTSRGNELKPLDPLWRSEIDGSVAGTLEYNTDVSVEIDNQSYNVPVSVFILPNDVQRSSRDNNHDSRMIEATGNNKGINQLQGIYFYRNERLIDWPGNGSEYRGVRTSADSHGTCCRWLVTIPSGLAMIPGFLDDSKTTVQVEANLALKVALQDTSEGGPCVKRYWHDEDRTNYYIPGQGALKGAKVGYYSRARARQNKRDIPHYCEDCEARVKPQEDKCRDCAPPSPPQPAPTPNPPTPAPTPPTPEPSPPLPEPGEVRTLEIDFSADIDQEYDGEELLVFEEYDDSAILVLNKSHPLYRTLISDISELELLDSED